MSRIRVIATDEISVAKAGEVARLLSDQPDSPDAQFEMLIGSEGLSLRAVDGQQKPLRVDLGSHQLNARRRKSRPATEALLQAVGVARSRCLHVIDATAGLGTDSFLLAAIGCDVVMFERSQVVGLLLEDGLARARMNADLAPIVARMTLVRRDFIEWLAGQTPLKVDVIYLDPMFPVHKGTALPGREMQYLQAIAGTDNDQRLIESALGSGVHRVVIKRPRLAAVSSIKPSFTITRSSCRFDVFVQ